MIRLVLLAMVCCSCGGSNEVWLDGYERGATITKRVGEFFSLKVKMTEGIGKGTWTPEWGLRITDSDGNNINHALMSWHGPRVVAKTGRRDVNFTELFLAKDLPAGAKLRVVSASYNIKSTPGPYMFSAPPEFISLESMPVQLQWRLSYNTELQAGDIITWQLFSDFYTISNTAQYTVSEATKTVHIGVDPEPPPQAHDKEEISCRIFVAKITRAGKHVSVNAAPTRSSTDC